MVDIEIDDDELLVLSQEYVNPPMLEDFIRHNFR